MLLSGLNTSEDVSKIQVRRCDFCQGQYVYYTFEVTNMSDKELVISDNSSLADKNANIASRTGVMYGITDSVIVKTR